MTPDCLSDDRVLDIASGRRAFDRTSQAHLATCTECRRLLAAAARGNASRDAAVIAPDVDEPAYDELGSGVVVAGRFELERFLGAGAMGVVWAAKPLAGGSRVALKVARSADPELGRRLARESLVTQTLDHPNIVRSIDFLPATATRGACLVLPLLDGEPLEAFLARRGALDLAEAARLLLPIADALGAAHSRGVIHRDLKPQNVFLTEGRVMVLDFGIAKLLPAWGIHSRLTQSGAVLGTPSYMAPEQLFGEPDVDACADLWALGAILFRMLAGRAPVRGDTVGQVLAALRAGTVDDLGSLVPTLPRDILALTRNALKMRRTERLGDATAFARVLAPYAAGADDRSP